MAVKKGETMKKECKYCCEGDNEYLFGSPIPLGALDELHLSEMGYIDVNKATLKHGIYIGADCVNFETKINYCPMCGRKL